MLDADTMATEQWLKHMVAPIEQGTCDLTIANPEPLKKTWVSQYYIINRAYLLDSIVTYSGNSMAFKANIVEDRLEYFFDRNVKVGVVYEAGAKSCLCKGCIGRDTRSVLPQVFCAY